MDFKFNVNDILKEPIVEINNNLIPPGFSGDRRVLWDTIGKISEVVNKMGEASAVAQGLPKPITTAERLRNSEHKLYFLIDPHANNGKGCVTGMLKTGKKGLYVFDRDGRHFQVSPPCILDFYIHESRQRTGLGKQLFEHMLQKEEIEPVKMAIDRPSDKLLGFLNKHYTLNTPVKQMNNYVVFDGFFPRSAEQPDIPEPGKSATVGRKQSANGLQKFSSPQGRYGAPRPPCSMGQIIHNQMTNNKNQEPTGSCQNYVSQSTPNVSVEQRILNSAYNQNLVNPNSTNVNQNQTQYTVQNAQNLVGTANNEVHYNQNQMTNLNNNYQQYNNNQQLNYNSQNVQPNMAAANAGVYYNPNQMADMQNYQQFNNIQQSSTDAVTQHQNQQYNIAAQNQSPFNTPGQNQMQYSTGQIISNQYYNATGDQNNAQGQSAYQTRLESPQVVNNAQSNMYAQQYQHNQEQQNNYPQQQNYANVNQRFENMNLNNQVSPNTGVNHIVSSNTTPNTAPDQMQTNSTAYSVSNPNVGWNQSSSTNSPQSQGYNSKDRSPDLAPQYSSASNKAPSQQIQGQNIANTQIISPNPSYQNVVQPNIQPNISNNPSLQIPQVNNTNQMHFPINQNTSQQQNLPSQPNANYIPQPLNHNIIPQQIQQPAYSTPNIPAAYNQTPGTQNPNTAAANNQINYSYPQNTSAAQVATRSVHSAKDISNAANLQMSRHNIVNESSSAPNMTNNIAQGNNMYVPRGYAGDAQVAQAEDKTPHNIQNQEINQNVSDENTQYMYQDGERLSYGYPPQCSHDVQEDGEKPHVSSKLERPQSLSIQKSEEEVEEATLNADDSKNLENDAEPTNIQNSLKAVKINEEAVSENLPTSEADVVPDTKTASHLTNQGYFDIKFYHNKLW